MSSTDEPDSVTKRLDALIRLTLDEQVERKAMKRKDQLMILDSVGLSSADIGRILGQPSKDVASALKKVKTEVKRKQTVDQ
jgi:DNA-directed RNA polymerase specialized sigma24 family protein